MPPEAISLALAASIYPPAVAAVIALGRGEEVRLRVFLLVGCALLTVFLTGALMLLVLGELPISGREHAARSGLLELAVGLVLLAIAWRLWRKPSPPDAQPQAGRSKVERYLESRRLAFVLGITLYVLPSPIYIGAVKAIADAKLSTANQLLDLLAVVAVMLWMIELPMAMLLAFPARAASALETANLWFARNGRLLAVLAAAGAGIYLAIEGLLGLLS